MSKKKFDLSKKLGNLEIKLVGYYEIQIKMITKIIKDSEKKKIIKKMKNNSVHHQYLLVLNQSLDQFTGLESCFLLPC